jgi:hypothetical protein
LQPRPSAAGAPLKRKRRATTPAAIPFQIITTTTTGHPKGHSKMELGPEATIVKSEPGQRERRLLSTRRPLYSVPVECEGHRYRATAGWFDDGKIAEIFLDTGKFGTTLQANADTAGVLVSLLLQHGVAPDVILHSISGPIAVALRLFMDDAP